MNLLISLTQKSFLETKDITLVKSLGIKDFIVLNKDYCLASISDTTDLLLAVNNKTPICKAYNQVIDFIDKDKYTNLVFVHDDVYIEDRHLETKLEYYLEGYDIIGLAGGANIELQPPALWHMMSQEKYGTVGHWSDDKKLWFGTTFGPSNKQVDLVDGLFIGVNAKKLYQNNLRFDERLPGFHHYDLKFCLDAKKLNMSVFVVPILVSHMSPGLRSYTPEFKASENIFLQIAK